MTAAKKLNLVSVDDYLDGELDSIVKHEYLGGVVYAMAGARVAHNRITMNTHIALGVRLQGKKCEPFGSDMKIRIQLSTQTRFYYPDTFVVCEPNPPTDAFIDNPVVIVEVLSKRTRRIDEGEKKDAYLRIPSLRAYILVEQDKAMAVVHRRTEGGWDGEVYEGLEAVIPLPEIETDLPLAEIYRGVEFVPEPGDDEE